MPPQAGTIRQNPARIGLDKPIEHFLAEEREDHMADLLDDLKAIIGANIKRGKVVLGFQKIIKPYVRRVKIWGWIRQSRVF